MAECTELMESRSRRLQEVASAFAEDDGNLAEKMQEMVFPSVLSVAESLNPDNSQPTQILLGEGNTAISGCNFNITNIYGGDNGALQKSSVTEVESPCPLPPRPKEPKHQAAGGPPSPSPKWAKSNEEMLLRVVPLATETEDCDDDLILVVWFCWDDNQTFQEIVSSEHDTGNVTLDSYDTIVLKRPNSNWCTIPVRLTPNNEYSWGPRYMEKKIQSIQVWNAGRGKCSFRIKKNHGHPESKLIYLTLQITKYNGDPAGTQFIIKKKIPDIKMPEEDKTKLLKLLDTKISVPSLDDSKFALSDDDGCGFDETSVTCWAIPYIDRLFTTDDDVIVTLWLCRYDKKQIMLEGLKGEQRLYGRELLDTENSFIVTNSEEKIETVLKHKGYNSFMENQKLQKAIDAHRIMQGMRAKFQFISKTVEDNCDYADRISDKIGDDDPSGTGKKLLSEKSRKLPDANHLLPKVKPNKLDVEICTWQGKQVPIEFRKVTEVTRFVQEGRNKTSQSHLSFRVKSRTMSLCRSIKRRNYFPIEASLSRGSVDWEGAHISNLYHGQGSVDADMRGAHISNLYHGQGSVDADMRASMFIPDPQQVVLRLFICVSQDNSSDNTLTIHVVLVTVNSPASHSQLTLGEWAALDSYDTFLVTSQVCGCYDPLVKVTFESHVTSHWHPESNKMVIDVEDVLKEGIVKCSCRFHTVTDSQNDVFFGTMSISQIVGKRKEEVYFLVKKKMDDIQTLIKEASRSTLENIMSPVRRPEDADQGVMLDEYQTCLAVSYVDRLRNITDDIILTVWICSIQQSKADFDVLCEDQKKVMKIQLDTENSFVFCNMTSPVYAEVKLHGLWTFEESLKDSHGDWRARTGTWRSTEQIRKQKVDPRRIREGGRAKFQFICKRTNENSNKFDVEISIYQSRRNQVQFMTRKKIEFFLQDDHPTNIQDSGTEKKLNCGMIVLNVSGNITENSA